MKLEISIGIVLMLCLASIGKKWRKRKTRIVILMGIILIFSTSLSAFTMRVGAQTPCYDVTVVVPQLEIKAFDEGAGEADGADVYCRIWLAEGGLYESDITSNILVGQMTPQYQEGFGSRSATYNIGYRYTVFVDLWDEDFWVFEDDFLASGSASVVADPSLNPQTFNIAETQWVKGGTVKVWITTPAFYDVTVVVPPLTVRDDSDGTPEADGLDVFCSIMLVGIGVPGSMMFNQSTVLWKSYITLNIPKDGTTYEYEHRFASRPAYYDVENMDNRYTVYVHIVDDDWPGGPDWDDLLTAGSATIVSDPSLNPHTFNMAQTRWVTGGTVQVSLSGPTYALTIATTAGGTTDPAPGHYTYDYLSGTVVSVTATNTSNDYYFSNWILDGTYNWSNPISVTMNQDHDLKAVFNGGGGAPEFPLGSAMYLAAIPLLFYLWWRRKQRTVL